MKYSVEQRLIAACPDNRANAAFVARTMAAVKAVSGQAVTARVAQNARGNRRRVGFFVRLRTLPTLALVAIITACIIAFSGAVYAAVRLAPAVVKIFSKETSQRGTTEYNVPSFASCVNGGTDYPISKFELNKDAPRLSDADIEKILQARCELSWVNSFVDSTWKTYGTHKQWQNGDDIFYARPDMLGTLTSLSSAAATIDTGGPHLVNYTAAKDQTIVAYANGQKVPLSHVKPGDTVFTVVRVAETYFNPSTANDNSNPRPQGIVAVLVMGLPLKYYYGMQNYLTPIIECDGNPGESCPGTGSIDVFPREGGEGAVNHAFVHKQNNVSRSISGTVIKLNANSVTLKTRTGKEYTATTPADDISAYNTKYAQNYTDMDATLKVGSTVMIRYEQAPNSNPQTIAPDQIQRIGLQIDSSNPKSGSTKQY